MQQAWVRIALALPLADLFDYRLPEGMEAVIGQRVRVPFGAKELIGLVIEKPEQPAYEESAIKEVLEVYDDLPPMPADWIDFGRFAGRYYQRPLGEALLPTMPTPLRNPKAYSGVRSAGGPVQRLANRQAAAAKKAARAANKAAKIALESASTPSVSSVADLSSKALITSAEAPLSPSRPQLSEAQQVAFEHIIGIEGYRTVLLHGVTGSGKTEVYLHAAEHMLALGKQVMVLVPEINLSPQLQRKFRDRFPDQEIAVMHSSLSDGERLAAWVAVQTQKAGIILGTRMAIFAPVQNLGLIVIDEEHDPSYKQLDALRYSARDLAVWRGHQLTIPVVLGSATPSLETWHHAKEGKYDLCSLPERVGATAFKPTFQFIDTRKEKLVEGISQLMLDEIDQCIARGQQALVFINRRGFAPVLHCPSCGWNSECTRCSAFMVMHRLAQSGRGPNAYLLQCHHCGLQSRPPRACPDCGNLDIQPLGRGTQKIEEYLAQQFPEARIQRIDADSTKRKGQAEELFSLVHAGEVDILVGTQMVSKGHDFKNLNLVCILNADSGLYTHDFRSSERLFAQLLQVAGRAGRHLPGGKVLLQTKEVSHPLYQALQLQDYELFAEHTLQERRIAELPPYSFQALITANHRQIENCLAFLEEIKALAVEADQAADSEYRQLAEAKAEVRFYDPVPLRIVRVFHIERAQLLIESASRARLQRFLPLWAALMPEVAKKHRVKYVIEVDPLEI